ncbi:MAG TPA: hypothetical protein VFT19_01605 [Solirubrobacterales bacterium]|nr:hypothetical protein [Solirubrobacterales bacterium]
MLKGPGTLKRAGAPSAASRIRGRIEQGGERFWRASDFNDLPPRTVARTLARLAEAGVVERARHGLYYRSRPTVVGPSIPSATAVASHAIDAPLHAAGLSAANVLRLTTQNPARPELATPATNPPSVLSNAIVHTRRPASRAHLNNEEGALIETLRTRGRYSDVGSAGTIKRLLHILGTGGTFERIVRSALDEPPRVRAMLGALGEELEANPRTLKRLRDSLNPLSTFDFGLFRDLPAAKTWQAR